MDEAILNLIKQYLCAYQAPKRRALSSRYPQLAQPIIFIKKTIRDASNTLTLGAKLKKSEFLPYSIASHSSLLLRKLGSTDMQLQINKVKNLQIAVEKLNGLVIPPGKIFSLWHNVGRVNKELGYVDGLVLSNGAPSADTGGGLCQLSNFLFWIFLHADVKIVERHHHSVDAFPDSGRTLPFGSGATIFCNYIDLQIKNISKHPLQIKLYLTDKHLKGEILSDKKPTHQFHIIEKNHCFIEHKGQYFRFNEIYRQTFHSGKMIKEELIIRNFAPVKYEIPPEYFKENGYKLISIT